MEVKKTPSPFILSSSHARSQIPSPVPADLATSPIIIAICNSGSNSTASNRAQLLELSLDGTVVGFVTLEVGKVFISKSKSVS